MIAVLPSPAEARRPSDRMLILGAVCIAALGLPLSFTGGAVATPAIARELGGSPAALNWVVNAFMLVFGSSLMAAGTLADEFGRRRIFAAGVAGFAFIALISAWAPDLRVLDFLRGAQGLAAAFTLAGGSAALAQEFDGAARARAYSLLGSTFGLGLAFGPILAGFIVEHLGWRWIFPAGGFAAVPALLFGVPRMRESRDPAAQGLDWPGTLSFGGALALFTFGMLQAPESGWDHPLVIGLFAGAALLIAAFAVIESHVPRPMLDLSLFRYPRFIGVQLLPIATCYAYVVLLVLLPIRFIGIEGRSEVQAGVLMAALSAPMLLLPFAAALLARRLSPGMLSGSGLLLAAGGLVRLGQVPLDSDEVIWPMLMIGSGAALPWGLMDGLSVSVVPKSRAGMAAGIFNTTRVAGEGIALASVNAILAGLIARKLGAGAAALRIATGNLSGAIDLLPHAAVSSLTAAYVNAFSTLCLILAAITAASAVAVLLLLSSDNRASG